MPAGGNEAERRGREPGAGLGAGEKQRGRGRPRQLGPAVPLLGGAWERSRWRGCPLVSCPASRAAAALRPSTCERRSCGHLEEARGEELPGAPRAVAGFSSPLSASSHHEETPGTRLLPRRPRAVPGALCPRCRAGPRPPRPPHPAAAAPGRAAQAGARALQVPWGWEGRGAGLGVGGAAAPWPGWVFFSRAILPWEMINPESIPVCPLHGCLAAAPGLGLDLVRQGQLRPAPTPAPAFCFARRGRPGRGH